MLAYLANIYGEDSVLAVVPLCMRDDAQEWFDSLDGYFKEIMGYSLDEWKTQLMRRFPNASAALVRADNIKHTFKDETTMDVRKYITVKQGLYTEAGETNADNIVRRIHDGLDPMLAACVQLAHRVIT
jgi:hypothetical protein